MSHAGGRTMIGLALLAAGGLLAAYGRAWRRLLRRPRLLEPAPPPPDAPLVSLLIPARNEERAIERCVRAALAQRYPRFEVIVLDDGSTDRTPEILAGLAGDQRLRLLRGQPLPPGWVGKCFACQQLADAARGEWLLFLDADTAAAPGLTAAMVAHATGSGHDLLTIFPFLELGGFWERLLLPPFLGIIFASFPMERVERPDARPEDVLANGQCILVGRGAYDRAGGHRAVRAEVLEDVRLAQRVRAAGYRVGIADGAALLRVRMYTSGREVLEGLTKNAAAGARSTGGRAWLAATGQQLEALGPLWLLGLGGLLLRRGRRRAGLAALAAGGAAQAGGLLLWGQLYRRLYGLSPLHGLLWPPGLIGYLLIALRGMWRVRRGRGVVWKGRSYQG